jgi:bifunctional non-homologous end joining protein LigD
VTRSDPLGRYRSKRRFEATPEPSGKSAKQPTPDGSARFVVQEHHARRLHWDLRLERDGVLASWAVPKGIPMDPRRNHLAVHTEDHPLEYLTFEGDIPKGQYGAGTMTVWDRGTYTTEKFRPDEVIVVLHGERVQGRYVLFQTDGDNWMIHRMDPPADPTREPMPEHLEPMLATLSNKLPVDDDAWAYEVKWDGIRALAYIEGGRIRLQGRRGTDITHRYPELRALGAALGEALGEALGATEVVLDGEIVAFDDERPSFERLQQRMHVDDARAIRRLANEVPVVYVIFDVLWLNGHLTTGLTLRDRRKLLEQLALQGAPWQTPAAHEGGGADLLEATKRLGLEGVVAKRLDSTYEPGRRSTAWRKIKNHEMQEFVVGGWLPGQGARSDTLGALVIGYYDRDALKYAGRVGTGFSDAELRRLQSLLAERERATSPFSPAPKLKDVRWVEPDLVANVRFTEWTKAGQIRHPAYLGLRDDTDPRDVARDVAREVAPETEPRGR